MKAKGKITKSHNKIYEYRKIKTLKSRIKKTLIYFFSVQYLCNLTLGQFK